MSDDPLKTVRKLLIEGQGMPERKVTPDARLLHDLDVDGEDAGELLTHCTSGLAPTSQR